jgi:transposase
MSHSNSILNLLNLKDENIIFDENFYSEDTLNNVTAKFFHGTLIYTPKACYSCGHVFDEKIIKHGFKASTIKIPNVSGFSTYLKLKKQRYFCKHCNSTFTLKTSVVNRNCFISNNTKLAIALSAKDKISEKDIAKNHNVSHSTVSRVIDSFYHHYKPNCNYIPKHLCFDEFKSVKSAAGAMSFIFCDSESGNIVDIVEDRRLHVLKGYFLQYSKAARLSVKTIVIDMYSPYISLIKKVFPNAKIIIDKFHILQLFSRALNKTRIKVMNNDKKNYNKLKKYWKLLLKDNASVDFVNYRYHRSFRNQMREIDIINYLLDLDPELKASYNLYHNVRFCVRNKDLDLLIKTLNDSIDSVSDYMKTSIKTIKKYIDYVGNTLKYDYNNGVLEGINNKIKVIKRIAFGYKCFYHFKNRILITQNLARLKTA